MRLTEEFRLGLRYALTGKHDKFVSFVSLMSALGIALGTAALIVVLAVMAGVHKELRGRILSVASHLEAIAQNENGFADWNAVSQQFKQHRHVIGSAPQVQKQALLLNGRESQGAVVRGILPAEEKNVSQLHNFIIEGSLDNIQAGSFKIMLGVQLARRLKAGVGDKVRLVAPQGVLSAAGFYPRMRQMEVGAIFKADLYQYDAGIAYIHLADAKNLYQLQGANVIRLKLNDVFTAPQVHRELKEKSKDVYLYDWTTSHSGLFQALVLEKRMMFIVLTLIIAVAAFNIISALVTIVRNKRGNIAIMRAFGATGGTIVRVFLFQGLVIGVTGILLGLLLGLPLAKNAGAIINWFEQQMGVEIFPASIYHFSTMPSIIHPSDVTMVVGVAFILTLFATIPPSWQGGRTNIVEALRHE